ncbi:MAG: DUF1648 domain-containing protein [Candidatus Paceibacterota bacterium]|jgi:uncharacterized membrane protein
MDKSKAIIIATILASFAVGFWAYPQMPEMVASHWNENGEVNGYMPKFWGVFLMPILSLVMSFLFIVLPKIDPMKANIEKFRNYYNSFISAIILFLFYIYLLTIEWNLGHRFDMVYFLIPALSALFYWSGILVEKAKMNWFIGIRTPWTMSSEAVWDKTHKLGGKLFKASALISLAGLFFGPLAFWFTILPITFVSFYLIIYSYLEHKKEIKK